MAAILRLLAISLCVALVAQLAMAESQQENEQRLDMLIQQIKKLKNSIVGTRKERGEAAKALESVEQKIGRLARELRDTEQRYQRQQAKLGDLQRRRTALAEQQQKQKALIAEQIRSAYTMGREKQLQMLLNQEDPAKLSRMLTYYDYFNAARRGQLDRYRATLAEISELLPQIETETTALAQSRETLAQQRQQLDLQRKQRSQVVAGLDSELNNQNQQLGELDKQRKELEAVLAAIQQEVADIPIPASYQPFKNMRGKMPWPIAGKRLNNYGAPRQGSAIRWEGVQLSGNEGDAVNAIHSGRVVYADWLRGAGLLMILDHGGDYLSLYAHNQSLLREEGDWVNGGEAIATVGNSGGQRQSGLYFEIRHKGKPTDPRQWCR